MWAMIPMLRTLARSSEVVAIRLSLLSVSMWVATKQYATVTKREQKKKKKNRVVI